VLPELDTAFGLAIGERPSLEPGADGIAVSFHPLRGTASGLDAMLANLTDGKVENGKPRTLSPVWVTGHKDDTLVLFLCRSNREGGSNNPRGPGQQPPKYIGMTLTDDTATPVTKVGDRWHLVAEPLGPVSVDTWTTIVHELAHSFHIADEYGGRLEIDQKHIDRLSERLNAQPRVELLVREDKNNPQSPKHLDMKNLKWRWRRLLKAGVLLQNIPEAAPGPFTVILNPDHATQFSPNDVVRFRTQELEDAEYSDRLVVVTVNQPARDQVVVKLLPGSTIDRANGSRTRCWSGRCGPTTRRHRTGRPTSTRSRYRRRSATTWRSWPRRSSTGSTRPTTRSTPRSPHRRPRTSSRRAS